MKRLSLFLTIFIVLLVGVVGAVSAQDWEIGENRIPNPDFEVDANGAVPTGWTLEDGKCCGRGADYAWNVDNEPHTGKRSLKVIGNIASGTNWHAKIRYESMSMELGNDFTVAFWAKVDTNEGKNRQVTTSLQMQHDPWTSYHSADITIESGEWQEYFDTFAPTANVIEDMWVGLSIAQSDVDFWVDDFRFFEGKPEDEIGADPADFAVSPMAKSASTWGEIKGSYR